jgi:hypothetical protein
MRIAIVMKVTQGPWTEGQIATWYDADAPAQSTYGGPWGSKDMSEHVALPEGLEEDCVSAVLVEEVVDPETGDVTPAHWELQEDAGKAAAKLQASREAKLQLIRDMREPKLQEVDVMVNELSLGERSDGSAIALYRTQLMSITDSYKDENGDATAALDALEADLSDLVWPMKP